MISCRELLFPVWCVFPRYNYSSKSTSQAPAFPNLKPHTPPCWISQSSHEAQKVWAIIPSLRACVHLLHLMLDEKHLDQLSQPASVCRVCVRFTVYRPSCVLQCMCLCVYVSWLDSCVLRNLGSAHNSWSWYDLEICLPSPPPPGVCRWCPSWAEIKDANRAINMLFSFNAQLEDVLPSSWEMWCFLSKSRLRVSTSASEQSPRSGIIIRFTLTFKLTFRE